MSTERTAGSGAATRETDDLAPSSDRNPGLPDNPKRRLLPWVCQIVLESLEGACRIKAAADDAGGSRRCPAVIAGRGRTGRVAAPGAHGPTLREMLDGAPFTLVSAAVRLPAERARRPCHRLWCATGASRYRGRLRGGDGSWDGSLWSAQVEADVRVQPGLLAGATLSYVHVCTANWTRRRPVEGRPRDDGHVGAVRYAEGFVASAGAGRADHPAEKA